MILINLCGGPGAGKTTLSYYLAYRLKKAGLRAEYIAEAAREHHIYDAAPGTIAPPLLDNQSLVAGQQHERALRLKRHNFEVAICDSPLVQGLLYCQNAPYAKNLAKLMGDLEKEYETYNVFINPRPGSYDAESRVQATEAEARALDKVVRKLMKNKFWMEVEWDDEVKLGDAVVALAMKKRDLEGQKKSAKSLRKQIKKLTKRK